MKCSAVEKKLIFYLEGDLPEQEKTEVACHLEGCSACTDKLHHLKFSMQTLESTKAFEPKPYLYTRIQARMDQKPKTLQNWVLAPLAIASVLTLGLFLGTLIGRSTYYPAQANNQEQSYELADFFNETGFELVEAKLLNE